MSDQEPTLDGITADQLMDHCKHTALIRYRAQTGETLTDYEQRIFLLGVNEGSLSMYEELDARNLIKVKP